MVKLITPKVWGEDAWRFMHVVALGFPGEPSEKDKREYEDFYESLTNVLPCVHCREGYKDIFADIPIRLDGTEELFQWTVDVHNAVNRKLGHDVMDSKWIRNVYIFREHERDLGTPSLDRESAAGTGVLLGVTATALAVTIGVWLYFRKSCAPKEG